MSNEAFAWSIPQSWQEAFAEGEHSGRKAERAAIVKWLRDGEFSGGYVDGIAAAVEDGLHLVGDSE